VGLVPRFVLDAVDPARWDELALHPSATIEARLERVGLGAAGGGIPRTGPRQ